MAFSPLLFKNIVTQAGQSGFSFQNLARTLLNHHIQHCEVYKDYLRSIAKHIPGDLNEVEDWPFLPISAFKHHAVLSTENAVTHTFESSGTTGTKASKHLITDMGFYHQTALEGFERVYGPVNDWVILALLPNYIERGNSSLVSMVSHFIQRSRNSWSGFYLDDLQGLIRQAEIAHAVGKKVLIIGVSYALLDLAELKPDLSFCTVMETGGMKGRRTELPKEGLHHLLKEGLKVKEIHSEYGMTELLSQAYAVGTRFYPPPWMQVVIKSTTDPFQVLPFGKRGVINVIDLANIDSCGLVETQDIGIAYDDGSFEVLGRFDHAEARGCNLLYETHLGA